MKNYDIEVEEILRRVVNVKANNIDEAIEIVSDKWNDEEIVLDSSDFVESSINNLYSKRLIEKLDMKLQFNPVNEMLTITCGDISKGYVCESVRDLGSCVKLFSTDFLENHEIDSSNKYVEEDIDLEIECS